MKVLWVIDVHATGPVLIRGHQVDGPHEVRFNGGLDQLSTDVQSPMRPRRLPNDLKKDGHGRGLGGNAMHILLPLPNLNCGIG